MNNALKNKFVVLIVILAVLACIFMFFSPQPTQISEELARKIAEAVIAQVPGSHAGLVLEYESRRDVTLHVDMSGSMNGYALPDPGKADTVFLQVINRFNLPNTHLQVLSSDYNPPDDYTKNFDFLRLQQNYHGNLDMADAIRNFSTQTQSAQDVHVFVSDSQPWDTENAPNYEKVADAINDFLTGGGRCKLLLYRSQYTGEYSSPLRLNAGSNPQVFYHCANRPFGVWFFGPPSAAVDSISADLEGYFHSEGQMTFGEPCLTIDITNRTLPARPGSGYGTYLGELDPMYTGKELGRIKDYALLRIKPDVIDSQGYVPLQFNLCPTALLTNRDLESVSNNLSVQLDCWEVPDKLLNGQAPVAQTNNDPTSPATNQLKLQHVITLNPEFAVQFVTNDVSSGSSQSGRGLRLVVSVKQPGPGRCYAWVMTILPRDPEYWSSIPGGFSTEDDQKSDDCGELLRLNDMLRIVAGKTDKAGSILFLTEFPTGADHG